jgi:phosphate transport system substrate-binding protein
MYDLGAFTIVEPECKAPMRPLRRTKRTLAIVAFTTLVSCSTPVVPASTPTSNTVSLRLYATTAMAPVLQDLTQQYSHVYPNFAFETATGDYQMILDKLLTGETPYVLTNHLPDSTSGVLAWPIGQDGIAVIVHPDNPITGLSTEQLRSIYLGHVSNWSEVEGNNQGMLVISREDGSGTRAEFERLLMGARQTTLSAQIAPSNSAMVESITNSPDAIGYVSMSYLDDRVRALNIDGYAPTPGNVYNNLYPLRSTMYVMGLAEPEGDYLAFISWVQSQDGQRVVAERYAPMIRPT